MVAICTKGLIKQSMTFFHPPASVAAGPLLLLALPFSIAVILFSFLNFHLLPLNKNNKKRGGNNGGKAKGGSNYGLPDEATNFIGIE